MARKKQARPETISGGYGAIPRNVMDSLSFKGASDKAKALLFALMRQHNGSNNGHLHLAKKWLYNQGWTCDENNRKARKELIERGLIVQTKWGGLNMGPDLFALTWYSITNYVGLEITAVNFVRGSYSLCTMPPTTRRKPPNKKSMRHDDRDSSDTTTETARPIAITTTELVKPHLSTLTVTTTEHNVLIPLPIVKTDKRRLEIKAKHDKRIS